MSRRTEFASTWWAQRWIRLLERFGWSARLNRGRSYARHGNVLDIDVQPGLVRARVQGSRKAPYRVEIGLKPLSRGDWNKVFTLLRKKAIYAARLLSGEMPRDIEEIFKAAEVPLFPKSGEDLIMSCTCPDWANPCKHVAAVYYLLGEQFEADPFLLFVLRGRGQRWMTEALRARRAGTPPPPADAPERAGERAPASAAAPALADVLDTYWAAPELPAISFEPAEVDALAVKRLGPPPFAPDAAEFEDQLEVRYRAVSAHAYRLALGEDAP
jgi:uncharacterized Zn finger protein